MRVHIAGAGIAGMSAALACSRAFTGSAVTIYEQADDFFAYSSGKNAAIARSYDADPVMAGLARQSICHMAGAEDVLIPGGLFIAPLEYDYSDQEAIAKQRAGLVPAEHEIEVGNKAISGFLIRDNGIVNLSKLKVFLAEKLNQAGVEVCFKHRLSGFEVEKDTIRGFAAAGKKVTLSNKDLFINAAGSWVQGLPCDTGLPLKPHKRHLFKVKKISDLADHQAAVLWLEQHDFYWVDHGEYLVLTHGDEVASAAGDYQPSENQKSQFARVFAGFFGRQPGILEWHACLRTFSLDRRPIIGYDTRVNNLFYVAGLGGQGVSISLGLAEIIFTALTRPGHNSPFSPGRFLAG